MNRRNLLSTGLLGMLAGLVGWKADSVPPYTVMKVTAWLVVGRTLHSCPKGGMVKVAVHRKGKPTGEVRLARCRWVALMPNQAVLVEGNEVTGGEC